MKHYGTATLPINSILLCSIFQQTGAALVWPSSLLFCTIGFSCEAPLQLKRVHSTLTRGQRQIDQTCKDVM
ncbi:hypothetical protein PAHAL_2G306200 [Panicum hallii]|uniref:Secreted protein n=1 Tax=Panicum hallii TaxID=206008 RepID=A0A2T8KR36_9POAL|nr:hypothetical protein PAHAL_2G306200 [Panicum hallii]